MNTPPASAAPNSYDQVPYSGQPFKPSYPPHLEALATILGLRAAPSATARVLELGCGSGSNLLPYAYAFPSSQVYGIDLAPQAIEGAVAATHSLGVKNIRFECRSITEIDPNEAQYDYIICHGVYSWVPPAVQQSILDLCAKSLSPAGVAYISYNTLPGWHFRGLWRETMLSHVDRTTPADEQVRAARTMLRFCAEAVLPKEPLYSRVLKAGVEQIQALPDWYLFHDFLEEHNEAVYFSEFAKRTSKSGLHYLADAEGSKWFALEYPSQVQATLARLAPDRLRYEQYFDLISNRMFRRSILCRSDAQYSSKPAFEPLERFRLRSNLRLDPTTSSPTSFCFRDSKGGMLQTPDATVADALSKLEAIAPSSLTFRELCAGIGESTTPPPGRARSEAVERLVQGITRAFLADFIELSLVPDPFTISVHETPRASALAQAQRRAGQPATNLLHSTVELDPLEDAVLPLLNGVNSFQAIAHELARRDFDGVQSKPTPDEIRTIAGRLARKALIHT